MERRQLTVKEFYQMMVEQGKEDWLIEVRYRSASGDLNQGQTTNLYLVEHETEKFKAIVL